MLQTFRFPITLFTGKISPWPKGGPQPKAGPFFCDPRGAQNFQQPIKSLHFLKKCPWGPLQGEAWGPISWANIRYRFELRHAYARLNCKLIASVHCELRVQFISSLQWKYWKITIIILQNWLHTKNIWKYWVISSIFLFSILFKQQSLR